MDDAGQDVGDVVDISRLIRVEDILRGLDAGARAVP